MALNRETRVGLTALVGLAAACVMVVFLGRLHFSSPGYQVLAKFRYVDSLKPAAPVLYGGGVKIGEVEGITIVDGLVGVHVRINKDVKIPLASAISIHTSGILGEKYVQVSASEDTGQYLADGAVVLGRDPGSLDRTLQRVEALTEFLEPLLADPKFRGGVQALMQGLNKVVTNLDEMVGENRGDIRVAVKDLRVLASELRKRSDELKPVLSSVQTVLNPNNTRKVLHSLDTLDTSMAKLDRMLTQIESKKGAVGLLIYDDEAGENLRTLLSDLKRHPWKLLWKK